MWRMIFHEYLIDELNLQPWEILSFNFWVIIVSSGKSDRMPFMCTKSKLNKIMLCHDWLMLKKLKLF